MFSDYSNEIRDHTLRLKYCLLLSLGLLLGRVKDIEGGAWEKEATSLQKYVATYSYSCRRFIHLS